VFYKEVKYSWSNCLGLVTSSYTMNALGFNQFQDNTLKIVHIVH